jgi:inhibitor of cysteine peptidase
LKKTNVAYQKLNQTLNRSALVLNFDWGWVLRLNLSFILSLCLGFYSLPTLGYETSKIHVDGKNNQFAITLPANPTTGFQWSVKQYDKTLLQIKEQDYKASPTQRLGAGGCMIVTFSRVKGAIYPKSTIILFRYSRSWEPASSGLLKYITVIFD